MQYIQNHTNCQIGIDDVAGFIGKRRTYVTKKFRQETGESITDFIIKSKIRDAKRLLRYSNRSLSEISTHLCFSSQAYFQTVFKKSTGMTPNEYRNVHNEKWLELEENRNFKGKMRFLAVNQKIQKIIKMQCRTRRMASSSSSLSIG